VRAWQLPQQGGLTTLINTVHCWACVVQLHGCCTNITCTSRLTQGARACSSGIKVKVLKGSCSVSCGTAALPARRHSRRSTNGIARSCSSTGRAALKVLRQLPLCLASDWWSAAVPRVCPASMTFQRPFGIDPRSITACWCDVMPQRVSTQALSGVPVTCGRQALSSIHSRHHSERMAACRGWMYLYVEAGIIAAYSLSSYMHPGTW
jgi:hypothetical protein